MISAEVNLDRHSTLMTRISVFQSFGKNTVGQTDVYQRSSSTHNGGREFRSLDDLQPGNKLLIQLLVYLKQ